jgi:hypothetical protein
LDAAAGPSAGTIAATVVFWVIAIVLGFLTSPTSDQPTSVWVIRVVTIVVGIGYVVWLILRERAQNRRGTPVERDHSAVDLWTIAHTMAGVVMGAWALPFPLVIIYTVAWEFFEKYTRGIGDEERLDNRIVDVVVAVMGWIAFAGITTAGTTTDIPWLLPAVQSIIR